MLSLRTAWNSGAAKSTHCVTAKAPANPQCSTYRWVSSQKTSSSREASFNRYPIIVHDECIIAKPLGYTSLCSRKSSSGRVTGQPSNRQLCTASHPQRGGVAESRDSLGISIYSTGRRN